MAYISVVIVIIKIGYLVALTPSIRDEYEHGKHVLFCNVSGLGTNTIYFLENNKSAAEISNNFNDCKTKLLKNAMECYCSADSVVACTIAMHTNPNYCYTWACTAIHDGVLQRSNSINVCNNDENNNSKKTTELDCLSVSTNVPMVPVRWVVDNMYNLDAGMLFPTEGFNKENISLLIKSMQRDENGSIVVCQLDEERQLHWAINILYPPALCSAYESIHSIHPTCTLSNGNPIIKIVRRVNVASKCQADSATLYPDVLMLCDAVNRVNTGAESFVGNKTGHFKLEILFEASITEFLVEGFSIHTNITLNEPRQVTFKCRGHGNPPPEMTLKHDAVEYGRGYSLLTHTMTLKGSDDCGNYTCIAANAFAVCSETISISCHIEQDVHQGETEDTNVKGDKQPIIIAVGVGASVVAICLVLTFIVCLVKRYNTCVSLVRHVRPSSAPERNHELNPAHSDINVGTHYAFFEEDDTSGSKLAYEHASSTELAEVSQSFNNETYSESIKALEKACGSNHWLDPDCAPSSKHGPKYVVHLDAIEDDPLYTGVAQPGIPLAASPSSSTNAFGNLHHSPEGITYSVVKKKRPDDTNCSLSNTHTTILHNNTNEQTCTDDCTYSVVVKKKTHNGTNVGVSNNTKRPNVNNNQTKPQEDDCTYSVVKNKRSPDDKMIIVGNKRNEKERKEECVENDAAALTDCAYSVVNKHKRQDQCGENVSSKYNTAVDYTYSMVNNKQLPDDPNNSLMRTTHKNTDGYATEKTSREKHYEDSLVNQHKET